MPPSQFRALSLFFDVAIIVFDVGIIVVVADEIVVERERRRLGRGRLAPPLRLLLERREEDVEHLVRVLLVRVDSPPVRSERWIE